MFGYVEVNKPELKIKEFQKYRSYYCGLCRKLNDNFKFFGRLTLNYDMVFLLMVLSDMYDEEEKVIKRRCFLHPFFKHEEITSPATDYASNMCILLTYHKLLDDIKDDNRIKSKLGMLTLKGKIKKIEKKYKDKSIYISEKMDYLNSLEKNNEKDLDKVSNSFGDILGYVFKYKDDFHQNDLFNLGFYLGKFIYLLDSYLDIEEDIKKKEYNPLIDLYNDLSKEEFKENIQNILTLNISEATRYFERLPLIENHEILSNILYSGVWLKFCKKENI